MIDRSKFTSGDALFWVLQIIFGFLIARTPFLYYEELFNPFNNIVQVLAITVAYIVTLWSWIDFSQIVSYVGYDRYNRIDMMRFLIDFIVVIAYMMFFLSIQFIDEASSIFIYLIWMPLFFGFYILSGLLRRAKYGNKASRVELLLAYFVCFVLLLLAYSSFGGKLAEFFSFEVVNAIAITAFGLTYVSYRMHRRSNLEKNKSKNKAKGLIIGVDVDGVIANQIDIILPFINARYKTNLSYEDITEWKLSVGESDISNIIIDMQKYKSVIMGMNVISGSIEAIGALYDHNTVDIVTARSTVSKTNTIEWLDLMGVKYDNYISLKEDKKSMHKMDVLIDDHTGNIANFIKNTYGFAILYDQPWNRGAARADLLSKCDVNRIFIAYRWSQIPVIIDLIKEKQSA